MRRAATLLDQAGYIVVDGQLTDPAGDPVTFKILLRQGAQEYLSIVELYMDALSRLGISVEVDLVDGAQYAERRKALDFDMTPFARSLSLSPGNEQRLYWGQEYADVEGTRNLMGLKSSAMDALIDALNSAKTRQEFLDAVRAMDRVLTAGRYVIPIYHNGPSRIAHKSHLKFPSNAPIYGDRIGFFPDVWWSEE